MEVVVNLLVKQLALVTVMNLVLLVLLVVNLLVKLLVPVDVMHYVQLVLAAQVRVVQDVLLVVEVRVVVVMRRD